MGKEQRFQAQSQAHSNTYGMPLGPTHTLIGYGPAGRGQGQVAAREGLEPAMSAAVCACMQPATV